MNDTERLWVKLEESIKRTPLENPRVKVFDRDLYGHYATVLSPSFDDMDENERQLVVWRRLFADFDEKDRSLIKFIFTQSPTEFAEVFGEEALVEFDAASPVH